MANYNRAIFIDRDGVINKRRLDHVKELNELELLPNVSKCIKKLKERGYLVVVITNQSTINRKLTTTTKVNKIHDIIQKYLEKNQTKIDGFYICPHTPEENCECRKPKPGLLLKASRDLEIDLTDSWMIGDNDTDIQAAKNAGCRFLKIIDNFTLENAVEIILKYRIN